ncbi:beta-lactamase family protein [Pontibacter mangrovi]|uniref:Beta-lactamase family protein n=2 Tax=Pontibacter mangrovi TaxID=2589816 RepID=A0A501WDH7_9BACT|nr:beta-lactamase family protein [Pontibacter mangrovi]
MHKHRGFNGTVLVSKFDKVQYKGSFGYADFRTKDTLNTHTAFQLASVSKQFTAMAIMMLQEEGKLQYDDSVQQYIPDFPYHGITIRQLLTHRSGLSNYTYFSDELWPDRNKPIYNDDVLQLMAVHKPQVYYPPNNRFDYSNTGYFLLASIAERASGMPFSQLLQQRIFKPLHMGDTFTFSDSLAARKDKVATGHTGGRRQRHPDYLDTVLGDKGMYSSVEDLYKWDQALYTEKLVKHETLQEAFTGTRQKRMRDVDYGFGWRIKQVANGDTVVFHAGLWHGYATYILRNPNDHSALILLSNVPNGSYRYLDELEAFLYPEKPAEPQPVVASSATK